MTTGIYIEDIDSAGTSVATYYWKDKQSGFGDRFAPGWYYDGGKSPIGGGTVDDVELPAGKGLWVSSDKVGLKLNFPALDLSK